MHIVLSRIGAEEISAVHLDDDGGERQSRRLAAAELVEFARAEESARPRWVWDDTRSWYPQLLAQGVRIDRCIDLALSHAILRSSVVSARSALALAPPSAWDTAVAIDESPPPSAAALFELDPVDGDDATDGGGGISVQEEFVRQQEAVASSDDPARLRLLLAAESAGALVAAEMRYAGLPWRTELHDALLVELLGPRPMAGARPARLEALSAQVRSALNAPLLNPDSQTDLLRALKRAGLVVTSTRSWELKKFDHPAILPLLEYKKLSRLVSANGWVWMETWIRDGRFHPDYVPGGVVTGRWATRGGGAMQLPRQVRGAVVADDGWKLVVADAAQLEPRILTGLASDTAMAEAGRGKDLYEGIVASGAVDERAQAKVAMLGAMYGSTTGDSGRLMPRLSKAFPRAIRLVEEAARAGERGDVVTSRLGRSSPRPGSAWTQTQGSASTADSTEADERRARTQARDWGRFTRNFVVQSSAAEWALCWMAELRKRLNAMTPPGTRVEDGPHLVYFLHDEVIVHTPVELADAVATTVTDAAREAGRLLFGAFPVEFPVTAAVVDSYADAK